MKTRKSGVANEQEENDDEEEDKCSVEGITFRSIQSKSEAQSEESKSDEDEEEEESDDDTEEEEMDKKKKIEEKVFKFHEKRFTNADKRALVKYINKGIGKLQSYEFHHFMAVKQWVEKQIIKTVPVVVCTCKAAKGKLVRQ